MLIERDGMTLDEVAGEFGVSRQAVQQTEAKAIRKLRRASVLRLLHDFAPGPNRYNKPIRPSGTDFQPGEARAFRRLLRSRFPADATSVHWAMFSYREMTPAKRMEWRLRVAAVRVREALEQEFGPAKDPEMLEAEAYVRGRL